MIRVGIVDDHQLVLDGLRQALEREEAITVAWSALSVEEARSAIARGTCDVVLVDVQLRDGSGLDLITRAEAGSPAFVVLSSWDRPQYARAALERGAFGYVLKTAPNSEVVAAIRAAAIGRTSFRLSDIASLQQEVLSARELQIVRLVAKGRSSDEVGALLDVSTKTVEWYLARLFRRWNVPSRGALSLLAERKGWLEDGEEGSTRR